MTGIFINTFKKALADGTRPLFGLWQGIPDTTCAEIGAGAGFDWVLVDGEHAPFDLKAVMAHLQAVAPYGIPTLVRPPHGDPALIKQFLDIGAQTLLVPMVETAAQARDLVKATRYPPQGIRGLGTSLARAARWNRIPGYAREANDQICLVVQVETALALENLQKIAAVPEVDGIFIGPSDLGASMGHPGNSTHPEVVAAIEQALATIVAADKYPGVLALTVDMAGRYIARGARFIGVGIDTLLLAQATERLARQYLSADKSPVSSSP